MIKRILIASLAAAAMLQAPAMASAADFNGNTSSPNYTLCKLLPWLPSCKLLFAGE
ncbi:hypothetical protein G7085_03455 [Tessaracoccus sp. HDW20]|uniref:hypothetical protein n=1 Tax=Tessaracoccus coleopterorum TaxID=2714950 RepID=UPI0018D46CB7|nr:hypothetical protein [Tessaracoccus coleopterorum]NHB84032.1 hypothetical protein [Tessaracoccus coleopterorum]